MHAFLEVHGYSMENFKMSYKSKPEARKEAIQQGLTKLKLFSMLKRIYRSLCGKKGSWRDKAEKRVYSLRKSQMAWTKVEIIQFQSWN